MSTASVGARTFNWVPCEQRSLLCVYVCLHGRGAQRGGRSKFTLGTYFEVAYISVYYDLDCIFIFRVYLGADGGVGMRRKFPACT